MNEAETRAEHIDPALKLAGWGVVEGSRILREYGITLGRLEGHGRRGKPLTADYVLVFRNHKLAVVEAKAWDEALTAGVAQAKNYAGKLAVRYAYSTNGQGIYGIDMAAGTEGDIAREDIRKKGKVPKNGSLFFTIFQTFMSGPPKDGKPSPYFGEYPPDFFDFIVIDECHRGGANDESNWRGILDYFAPAVQLGLTATPKRKDNVDTYAYFGDPVFIYSLKEGINDGFLTPFKVKQISTTLDEYVYTSDDKVVEGEVQEGKIYTEPDFNKIIEIREREAYRVNIFMGQIDQREKTLGFCATQDHALAVRDLVNQMKA